MHEFLLLWQYCGEFIQKELPEFVDVHTGMTGGEQRRLFCAQKPLPCGLVRASHRLLAFVGLGHDGEYIYPLGLDERDQFNVQGLGRQARIEQRDHPEEVSVAAQIPVDERGPFFAFGFGAAGVSVTREVDEIEIFRMDLVKIQAARFSRSGTGLGQIFPAGEFVQQRRFPDIGTTGEGKLRQRHFFQLIDGVDCLFQNYGAGHETTISWGWGS